MSLTYTISSYYPRLKDLSYRTLSQINLPLKDVVGKNTTGNWKDSVEIVSKTIPSQSYIRSFDIEVGVSESISKEVASAFNIDVSVEGERVPNAGQVIGDIRFYDVVLNETNFDATLTPFGYGKWKKLVTGDYIYQRALCKYAVQASLSADRPNAQQYLHCVDVPDVVDSGTVNLTLEEQPLFVAFSPDRKFHIVPEVNVTVKSFEGIDTTASLPTVLPYNITTEGFYVTMKHEGAFVAGKITYAARGY